MNKYLLNQILNVLLLPLNEIDLYQKDYIAELAIRFYQVKHSRVDQYAERKASLSEYEAVKRSLADYICHNQRINPKSLDEIFLYLELYYPLAAMNLELEKFYSLGGHEDYAGDAVCRSYINNIFRIANSLLTLRDGDIAIRIWNNGMSIKYGEDIFGVNQVFDKVEIWNTLSRSIIPDLLIAAFYVDADLDVSYLYRQTGMISLADNLLGQILKKGVAETHLHLHAGHNYNILWSKAIDPMLWIETSGSKGNIGILYKRTELIFAAAVFRLVAADYLEYRNGCNSQTFLDYICLRYKKVRENLLDLFTQMHNGTLPGNYDKPHIFIRNLLEELSIGVEAGIAEQSLSEDFLINTIYEKYRCYQSNSELIILVKALEYININQHDYYFLKLFIQYIRIKNDYFSNIIQAGTIQGITYFQKYFSNAVGGLTLSKNSQYESLVRSIIMNQLNVRNIKKLEIRITPQIELDQFYDQEEKAFHREIKKKLLIQIKRVLKVYRDYINEIVTTTYITQLQEDLISSQNDLNIPTIGIIFHFIKMYSLDNVTGESCWISFMSKQGCSANHKLVWRRQLQYIATCIADIRNEVPYLNEYIIGIDAASNENDAEPWLFTPVYTSVRSSLNTKPLIYTEPNNHPRRIQNLGFTYHVGEDYRHILSGFRHIDEVIEHFHFVSGDRLGHAIALGNDVRNWINENEIVAMPILEHFENLLWLWGNIVFRNMKLPVSAEELDGKIMKYARQLYKNITGINVFLLYEVYQDKFLKKHDELFKKFFSRMKSCWDKEGDTGGNYFCKYYVGGCERDLIWDKDKLLCTHFCPVYEEQYNKVILVENNEKYLELYSAIQKELISKIEKSGIYIETNPTSNTVIGEVEGIFKHYIMNLNSVEKDRKEGNSKVLVTINSDDPVVFNTNVENEFAYIYHALIHRGYKKEDVLNWIDKVRQYGVDSSFIKSIKTPEQMVNEIDYIIRYIDDEYLKC